MRIALHNLGCKVNSYELDGTVEELIRRGYEIVHFEDEADIYIINTCSVTNIADRKSRQMLHRAKKQNPDAVVVAVGCYVQTDTEGALKDDCTDLLVGNNKKKELVDILERYLEDRRCMYNRTPDKTLGGTTVININAGNHEYENISISGSSEHTRAYMKIQDGCNQFCSYCIIPYARGRVRSRSRADILEESERLAKNGYREVVVTGIHLSSYGMDFAGQLPGNGDYLTDVREETFRQEYLLNIIRDISRTDGIERIRLGSLEPRIITERFAKELKSIDKVCPHFHLSLQSGCDATLKRMNRHYSTAEYKRCVDILRACYDNPAITTDVIVGFPGETEEEFETTVHFLQNINLYEMHIFKYSRRRGTVADRLPGQLTEAVKAKRSSRLMDIEREQSAAYRRSFEGRTVPVLLEEETVLDGDHFMTGFTPEYVRVALRGSFAPNTLINCSITGSLTDEIMLGSRSGMY